MIATTRGLAIAVALAVVLAVVLAIDLAGERAPGDRAIVSGFVPGSVTALAWEDGTRAATVVRDPKASTGWTIDGAPADARTIESVLAALRGARWQRTSDRADAAPIARTLVVERAGAAAVRIGIGRALEGGEQQWIVIGDRALLVDTWVARALAPDPLTLRVRTPLQGVLDANELVIGAPPGADVVLRGNPRRLVDGGREIWIAPELVDELERALLALTIVAPDPAPARRSPIAEVKLDGTLAAAIGGPCPDGRLQIAGPSGQGCVDASAWQAVTAALARFRRPLAELVERRPLPLDRVATITLPDGGVLDLAKRPRIVPPAAGSAESIDADPARVLELAAMLGAPGDPVPLPSAAKPVGQLVATHDKLTVTLDLYGKGLVARRGEPIALRIGEAAYAILARPYPAYRDPTLWLEEPTTIQRVTIDGVVFARGATLDEWTRMAGAAATLVDDGTADALDQLVELLASPRRTGELPEAAALRHAVELAIEPPVGAPSRRALRIGKLAAGCAATVDDAHVLLDPAICAAIDRLVR